MKISYKLFILAAATSLNAFAFGGQEKFDAMSNLILNTYDKVVADPSADLSVLSKLPFEFVQGSTRSDIMTKIIVELKPEYTASDIEAQGLEVLSELGSIVVARGTMDDIKALADCDCVQSLSFGNLRRPMMNVTRQVTGAETIQAGTGLPQKYDGTGVVAGLWDTGIDVNHINFLDSKGNSRIKRFWYFTGTGGSAKMYTNEDIGTFETDNKSETHGTHTLGILAGSWNGRSSGGVAIMSGLQSSEWSALTNNPYYGMAPGAEIAAGGGDLYDPNTIEAVSKIVDYAASVKKPVVINLSIGSNSGPHDGTDNLGKALNEAAQKGAIICVSAGNEGGDNISITKEFTSSDNSVATFLKVATTAYNQFSCWSNSAEPFVFTIFVYNRKTNTIEYSYDFDPSSKSDTFTLGYMGTTNQAFTAGFGARSFVTMDKSYNTTTNKRYNISGIYSLTPSASNNLGANYAIGFKVKGAPGQRIELVSNSAEFTNYGVNGYVNGNPDFSLNDVCCGPNVIAVGSYNGRVYWPTKAGVIGFNDYKVGGVSPFSSYGTLFDGRVLPDVVAPGAGVVSSISTSYYNNNLANNAQAANQISAEQKTPNSYAINPGRVNYYYAETGTSMSSPACAGAIALWLQANPQLTVADVKKILKSTNDNTNLPTATPMGRWGGGKLNALAGLKSILDPTGVQSVVADGDEVLFTPTGYNEWEVFVTSAKQVKADVYALSGQKVASLSTEGDTLVISGEQLGKGVYVVTVNGGTTQRIAVR